MHNAATLLTIKYHHVAAGFFQIVDVLAKLAHVAGVAMRNRLSFVFETDKLRRERNGIQKVNVIIARLCASMPRPVRISIKSSWPT